MLRCSPLRTWRNRRKCCSSKILPDEESGFRAAILWWTYLLTTQNVPCHLLKLFFAYTKSNTIPKHSQKEFCENISTCFRYFALIIYAIVLNGTYVTYYGRPTSLSGAGAKLSSGTRSVPFTKVGNGASTGKYGPFTASVIRRNPPLGPGTAPFT